MHLPARCRRPLYPGNPGRRDYRRARGVFPDPAAARRTGAGGGKGTRGARPVRCGVVVQYDGPGDGRMDGGWMD